jgi:hypothetical protein
VANRSYLCLVDKGSLRSAKAHVLAMDVWAVPLLWLALFRPRDVVCDSGPGSDRQSGPRFAPVADRKIALAQLDDAVPYLNKVFKDQGPLDEHAALFRKVFGRPPLRFVRIDLLEVAYAEDPQAYYQQLVAALQALENKPPPAVARKALLALTHLRLKKKFPPARCYLEQRKMTKDDDWNMARLLGTEWEEPVPWEPSTATPEKPSLHQALLKGDLARVKHLLQEGADPNQKDWLDGTPLQYAVKHGPALVRTLLRAGADPQDDTALAWAAAKGEAAVVRLLLRAGGNPNARREAGNDPVLVCACQAKQDARKLVRLLLDAGADVNLAGGWTPLGAAVLKNDLDLVRLLVQRGAHVNAKDRSHRTALQLAETVTKNAKIIEWLRRQGAK